MGAKMKRSIGAEIFAQPTIKRRKGMRWRKPFFKQKAHRIAFISKCRLDTDKDITELKTEHKNRPAIALLLARCWTPLCFNLRQPTLAPNMVIDGNTEMHIRIRAISFAVTVDDGFAQHFRRGWNLDRVALGLHSYKRFMKRLEYR